MYCRRNREIGSMMNVVDVHPFTRKCSTKRVLLLSPTLVEKKRMSFSSARRCSKILFVFWIEIFQCPIVWWFEWSRSDIDHWHRSMDVMHQASIERRGSMWRQSCKKAAMRCLDLYILFQLVEHHDQRDLSGPESLPEGQDIPSMNSCRKEVFVMNNQAISVYLRLTNTEHRLDCCPHVSSATQVKISEETRTKSVYFNIVGLQMMHCLDGNQWCLTSSAIVGFTICSMECFDLLLNTEMLVSR